MTLTTPCPVCAEPLLLVAAGVLGGPSVVVEVSVPDFTRARHSACFNTPPSGESIEAAA